jgi:hypothetical protein
MRSRLIFGDESFGVAQGDLRHFSIIMLEAE